MKRLVSILAVGLLVGCEGAVLVNNRPAPAPRDGTVNEVNSDAQAAGATVQTDATVQQSSPPTTQQVETSNTRITSPNR